MNDLNSRIDAIKRRGQGGPDKTEQGVETRTYSNLAPGQVDSTVREDAALVNAHEKAMRAKVSQAPTELSMDSKISPEGAVKLASFVFQPTTLAGFELALTRNASPDFEILLDDGTPVRNANEMLRLVYAALLAEQTPKGKK